MRKGLICLTCTAAFGLCALTTTTALGAGFALIEQSVSGLGNAYSGGAAAAEDAATVFFNPAGMTRLKGMQGVAGLHYIMPSAKFKDSGSTTILTTPLSGGNGGEGGKAAAVPNAYLTSALGENLVVGLGINTPFGLGTEYDKNWVGRYHAINSEMMTININPAIAIKLNKMVSLGLGVNAQYLKAELSNAIDFGTLDDIGAFAAGGIPANALGLSSQNDDGYLTLEGDSWAYGVNAGLLIEFNEDARLGLAYRQGMKHDVKGTADFTNPAVIDTIPSPAFFKDTDVTAKADLPDTYSASYYQRVNPMIAVMADATLTKWSSFKELRFKFASGQADGVTTESWDDSWRYSVGATVNPSEALTLRLGVAVDQTPITDAKYRTPRIPDEDRTWAALGMGYAISERMTMNLGYAHLFVKDPKINKTASGEDLARGALKGTYDASVDIASAELVVKF